MIVNAHLVIFTIYVLPGGKPCHILPGLRFAMRSLEAKVRLGESARRR